MTPSLNQATLRKTQGFIADNDMIENTNINQCQGFLQALGNLNISLAGVGNSRWMIMRDNHSACLPPSNTIH